MSTGKLVTNDWVPDDAQYDDSAAVAFVAPVVGSRLQTQQHRQDNVGDVTLRDVTVGWRCDDALTLILST